MTYFFVGYKIYITNYAHEVAQNEVNMRSKNSKIIVVLLLLIAICCLMTACSLLDDGVKKADISPDDNLVLNDDGIYEAQLNKKFTITVDWHNKTIIPGVVWHIVSDERERIVEGGKILEYTFDERTDDIFIFYAVVDGEVKTNELQIKVVNAQLDDPTIVSRSHEIHNGVIQQKFSEKTDVNLEVGWNDADIDPSLTVSVSWKIGGVEVGNESAYTYSVSDAKEGESVEVMVYIWVDEAKKLCSSVTLIFISSYDPVDNVTVVPLDDELTELCDGTFFVCSATSNRVSIRIGASAEPVSSNMESPCEWTVTTIDGERTLVDDGREVSLPLTNGKNVVYATVDNIKSRSIIVYALPYTASQIPTNVKSHILNKFDWMGESCDSYIHSEQDLENMLGYAVSQHQINYDFKMYIARNEWRNTESFLNACSQALSRGNQESGYFTFSVGVADVTGSFRFVDGTEFASPTQAIETDYVVKQANNYVRYSVQSGVRTSLPIDSVEQQVEVEDSNELYRAVMSGYKPRFANTAKGAETEHLYNSARNVLKTYVRDDMTEKQKTDVIFDWIVNEVEYDYAVAENVSTSYMCNAFFLEGVFNDRRAVCDGKSKAFSLLCGMEKIRTMRIIGRAGTNEDKNTWQGHAWNKVLIDCNNDGIREWFVVDTTWGDVSRRESVESKNITEYINYAYYLVTDKDIADTHTSDMSQPVADTEYNVFKDIYVTEGGVRTSLYVTSIRQRDSLIKFSKQNGNMCLCVYLDRNVQTGLYGWEKITLGDNIYIIYAV